MVAISSWHWRPRRRPVLVLVAVSVRQKELTNVFPGRGAGFLGLGGKTEGTAKNGGKNEENGGKTVKIGREMA